MDLDTIMKAIAIVGAATDAGEKLFEGFKAITSGETQEELKRRYAEARPRSDDLHKAVQADLSR